MANKDSKDNSNRIGGGGIGFLGLLSVAFIVLKLCHVIDWPWIWVLVPIWGSVGLGIIAAILLVIIIAESDD